MKDKEIKKGEGWRRGYEIGYAEGLRDGKIQGYEDAFGEAVMQYKKTHISKQEIERVVREMLVKKVQNEYAKYGIENDYIKKSDLLAKLGIK